MDSKIKKKRRMRVTLKEIIPISARMDRD